VLRRRLSHFISVVFVLFSVSSASGLAQTDLARVSMVSRPWSCWTLARAANSMLGAITSDECGAFPAQMSSIHFDSLS
jgi:hypothetical protein